uniref:Uncharacterized protein n=1 Tax=Arundo donax TaxID=35708 RepID=A0A0A8ZMI2_ARUDO
MKLSVAPLGIR